MSAAISLSPCITCTSTAVWLSAAVEKIWLFFVGIVVFLSISFVATPPSVSMESESGVTSRRSTSFTSPVRTPAWIAAPTATHSSGLIPLNGSLPVSLLTASCTAGILVDPPTRMTFARSAFVTPASAIAFLRGSIVLSTRSAVSWSNLALVRSVSRCSGPSAVTVMNGRLMFVVCADESSFLAFSAASLSLCRAILSDLRSTPCSCEKLSASQFMITLSKSSPPRCVSPFVASTSNTPSPSSRTDTSNVPPPRS